MSIRFDEIFSQLEPSPGSYLNASKKISSENVEGLRNLNLAVLSSFTAEIISPYLHVECARRGIHLERYFGPYNQFEQLVFSQTSALYGEPRDVVLLMFSIEDFSYSFLNSFSDAENELDLMKVRITGIIEGLRRFSDAYILVANFPEPFFRPDISSQHGALLQRANVVISDLCKRELGVYLFDLSRLVSEVGSNRWYDRRLHYIARVPFGFEGQLAISKRIARYIRALFFPPSKCLIVDLDNTLWGGVLGEDGLSQIQLGDAHPGNVYKEFQRYLLFLQKRGILLAIASRNNEEDVLEAFIHHPEMILKWENFAAKKISWQDKTSSIRSISAELGIGLDSLVFFDDSALERAWVEKEIPEVKVIQVPRDAVHFVDAIENSEAFDQIISSPEDANRVSMYQQSGAREALRLNAISVDKFLEELEILLEIGLLDSMTIQRVAQLIAKTNQFNLTTRRHSIVTLQRMVEEGAHVLWARVSDTFGDNGLVGVAIVTSEKLQHWRIDTFLLSCRVLGRKIEKAFLAVLQEYLAQNGASYLIGEYIPSSKNSQVVTFYPDSGFDPIEDSPGQWIINLERKRTPKPDFIRIGKNPCSVGSTK